MSYRLLCHLLLFTTLTTACVPVTMPPFMRGGSTNATAELAANARQAESAGQHAQAATQYLQLALQSLPPQQQTYQLYAIDNYIKANRLDAAEQELNRFNPLAAPELTTIAQLTRTRLYIAQARYPEAEQLLNTVDINRLTPSQRTQHQELQAQILEMKGDILSIVRLWIQAEQTLAPSEIAAIQANHDRIWRTLSTLPPAVLQSVPQTDNDLFTGWVALALIARDTPPENRLNAIQTWRARFPAHPATQQILSLLATQNTISATPLPAPTIPATPATPTGKHIALLLPLSGQFKPQAQAVRDAFFTAWYADTNPAKLPVIVQDTDVATLPETYQQMVNKNASVIVVGLEKEIVRVLTKNAALPVPTLALNRVEGLENRNLYQFSLSPEAEAAAVANRAFTQGIRTASVLASQDSWGNRVSQAFVNTWQNLGGRILATQTYGKDDIAATVQKLLTNSGPVEMVFIAGNPTAARQIRPAFNYYSASKLTLYATSNIYSGLPDQRQDRDLEGVIFGDMPVLLPSNYSTAIPAFWQQLQQRFPQTFERHIRLYAFGADAYLLASQLAQSAPLPVQQMGLTGQLSVDIQGVVLRELTWARFENGLPVVSNP